MAECEPHGVLWPGLLVETDDELPRDVVKIVDPHHAIRAGNITVAIVRCGPECPPEHGWSEKPE